VKQKAVKWTHGDKEHQGWDISEDRAMHDYLAQLNGTRDVDKWTKFEWAAIGEKMGRPGPSVRSRYNRCAKAHELIREGKATNLCRCRRAYKMGGHFSVDPPHHPCECEGLPMWLEAAAANSPPQPPPPAAPLPPPPAAPLPPPAAEPALPPLAQLPPPRRPERKRTASARVRGGEWADDDEPAAYKAPPPQWKKVRHQYPSGTRGIYIGPDGQTAPSLPQAWTRYDAAEAEEAAAGIDRVEVEPGVWFGNQESARRRSVPEKSRRSRQP